MTNSKQRKHRLDHRDDVLAMFARLAYPLLMAMPRLSTLGRRRLIFSIP